MNYITTINTGIRDYAAELPRDIAANALIGATISIVVEGLLGNTVAVCATYGALAAAASVIDGLITPIIKSQFADARGNIGWEVLAAKKIVVMLCVTGAAIAMGAELSPLMILAFCIYVGTTCIFEPPGGFPADRSNFYYSGLWIQ